MQSEARKVRSPTSIATPGGFLTKEVPGMYASKFSTIYKPYLDFLYSFEWNHPANDPKQQFLDIGCGTGDITREHILPRCPPCQRLLAVDYSMQMVEYAREHFAHPKIEYRQMDIGSDVGDFLAENGTFQRVYCLKVIHLVKDQDLALANISRLMTPGGECQLLFFGRMDQFEFCRRMAKLEPWTKYSEVLEAFVPRSHDIIDADELKSYIKDRVCCAGLEIIKLGIMQNEKSSDNAEAAVEMFMMTNPVLPILPEEEKAAFIADVRKYVPIWHAQHNEEPVPCSIITVHAMKPQQLL